MANPLDEQIDRDASWAATFGENATGSQRRQYAQHISDAADRDKERQAAQFEALQLRDPRVGNLVLNRQKEERQRREGLDRRSLEERKFNWAMEKDIKAQDINARREEINLMREQRLMRQAERETEDLKRVEQSMFNVQEGEAEMRRYGLLPGTEGYAAGIAALVTDNPYLDNEYRKSLMENAFIEGDPAEAAAAMARGATVTTITDPQTGKKRFNVVERQETPETAKPNFYRDRDFYAKERARALSAAEKLDEKKSPDARNRYLEEAKMYEGRMKEADDRIRGVTSTKAPEQSSNNFTDPDSYKKAFSEAPSGAVLMYNGKAYKKP